MQPFFGSKIKGKSGYESHEGILDGLGGVGSQQFKKQERAPLFKLQVILNLLMEHQI